MRVLVAVAAAAIVVLLGALQAVSSVALRERARPGAWMTLVPDRIARAVDALGDTVPVPGTLRLVLARSALARADLDDAARQAALVGAARDRLDLAAAIAARRGDTASATRAYVGADDVAGLETLVAQLAARGRLDEALALQRATVARLRDDRTEPDALADALFALGRLEQTRATTLASGTPHRRVFETRALDAYDEAARLAPYAVAYAIAVGNQDLNLGDLAAAERAFERARAVDPTSAEPLTGLGDVAFRRGDVARARDYLARARALAPEADAVRRLAGKLQR